MHVLDISSSIIGVMFPEDGKCSNDRGCTLRITVFNHDISFIVINTNASKSATSRK